jgi:hypothetical protein
MKYCKWCRYKFNQTTFNSSYKSMNTLLNWHWAEMLNLVDTTSAQWLWVCFFIYPHNCKGQCCMVIVLIFMDVAKHLTLGGGVGCRRILPEIWTSIIIELFLIDFHCHRKFPKKSECGGPPPENVYILEAPTCKRIGSTKITTLLYLNFNTVVGFTPAHPLSLCPRWS